MQGFDGGMGGSLMPSSLNVLGFHHGLHLHQLTDEPLTDDGAFLFITLGSKQALSFRFVEVGSGLGFQ